MNSNSTSAVVTQFLAKPDPHVSNQFSDGIEQARILYVRRRFRISLQIAAIVAECAFGEVRRP